MVQVKKERPKLLRPEGSPANNPLEVDAAMTEAVAKEEKTPGARQKQFLRSTTDVKIYYFKTEPFTHPDFVSNAQAVLAQGGATSACLSPNTLAQKVIALTQGQSGLGLSAELAKARPGIRAAFDLLGVQDQTRVVQLLGENAKTKSVAAELQRR